MKTLTRITTLLLAAMLLANNSADAQEPTHIAGVRQEVTTIAIGEITTYYRDDEKILEKIVPKKSSLNSVFYIYLDGNKVFTYKVGVMGTEFHSEGNAARTAKRPFTIKLGGDRESRVVRITLYTKNFSETLDGFWLKKNAVIPWSSEDLEKWRERRRPPRSNPK